MPATHSSTHPQLATLARAVDRVVLGPVGFAAVEDELGEAYVALSAADSAVLVALEPDLLALVEKGSPAAIVYAALLLRRIDRLDPHALLRRYAQDERPCLVFLGGCAALPMNSLSEVVRWVGSVPWVPPQDRVRDRHGLR